MSVKIIPLLDLYESHRQAIENFKCSRSNYHLPEEEKIMRDHNKIDLYLKEKAIIQHYENITRTHVLFNTDTEEVIGYFSLSNDSIDFKKNHSKRVEKRVKEEGFFPVTEDNVHHFPATYLLYFAVDQKYQRKKVPHIGVAYSTILMGEMFEVVKQAASLSASTLIVLEATLNSIEFYKKFEFKTFEEADVLDPYEHMLYFVSDLF